MKKDEVFFPRTGFTLVELMIVVILVGLLTTMAYPNYVLTREKALDKEAVSALMMVRSSERVHYARMFRFYPFPFFSVANMNDINGNLSLDLDGRDWAYIIATTNATFFQANATRTLAAYVRTWTISNTGTQPTCTGSCL